MLVEVHRSRYKFCTSGWVTHQSFKEMFGCGGKEVSKAEFQVWGKNAKVPRLCDRRDGPDPYLLLGGIRPNFLLVL